MPNESIIPFRNYAQRFAQNNTLFANKMPTAWTDISRTTHYTHHEVETLRAAIGKLLSLG
jgi:hypothetical protein